GLRLPAVGRFPVLRPRARKRVLHTDRRADVLPARDLAVSRAGPGLAAGRLDDVRPGAVLQRVVARVARSAARSVPSCEHDGVGADAAPERSSARQRRRAGDRRRVVGGLAASMKAAVLAYRHVGDHEVAAALLWIDPFAQRVLRSMPVAISPNLGIFPAHDCALVSYAEYADDSCRDWLDVYRLSDWSLRARLPMEDRAHFNVSP